MSKKIDKPSNVSIGDDLRNRVYDLLKSFGKQNIQREYKLEGKKADVYFEDSDRYSDKVRVAIECKNYSTKLGVSTVSTIISDYDSSRSCFDVLIILHREGLQSDAQLKVRGKEWIKVNTFEEFYFSLINFRNYLTIISNWFDKDGLNNYYIPPKDPQGHEIEEILNSWANDSKSQYPIAVLAGYGMGKTSLSYKIVKTFAQSILDGNICRIPIYLRLGDFVSETGVESLICKTFSSTYPVDGFNYERFIRLNRAGHFLIIFDGFDEMKHAMPFTFFKKIFRNICELVTENSKVIVLGRPSAFTTEVEKEQILHGKDFCGDVALKDPNFVDFKEVSIIDFDIDGAKDFIEKYFSYRQSILLGSDDRKGEDFRRQRLKEMTDSSYQELIRRPVHARMLVELSLSHNEPMEAINRYRLYDRFINQFYEREHEKPAREHISINDRRKFIEQIAYHFWKMDGKRYFHISEIRSIKHNLQNSEIHKADDDLPRELLIGSVLEKKDDGYYYFGHRSFQEFLVSSRFLSDSFVIENEFEGLAKSCNEEILAFISEGGRLRQFIEACESTLTNYRGEIEPIFVRFLVENNTQVVNSISDIYKYDDGPWCTHIRACKLLILEHDKSLRHISGVTSKSYQFMASMLGLLINENFSEVDRIVKFVVGMMHQFCFEAISKFTTVAKGKWKTANIAIDDQESLSVIRALIMSVKPILNNKDELTDLDVQYLQLVDNISSQLSSKAMIIPSQYRLDQKVRVPIIGLKEFSGLLNDDINNYIPTLRNFWRSKPEVSDFVNVISKEVQSNRSTLSMKPKGLTK